jgi:hypothetical protein
MLAWYKKDAILIEIPPGPCRHVITRFMKTVCVTFISDIAESPPVGGTLRSCKRPSGDSPSPSGRGPW